MAGRDYVNNDGDNNEFNKFVDDVLGNFPPSFRPHINRNDLAEVFGSGHELGKSIQILENIAVSRGADPSAIYPDEIIDKFTRWSDEPDEWRKFIQQIVNIFDKYDDRIMHNIDIVMLQESFEKGWSPEEAAEYLRQIAESDTAHPPPDEVD